MINPAFSQSVKPVNDIKKKKNCKKRPVFFLKPFLKRDTSADKRVVSINDFIHIESPPFLCLSVFNGIWFFPCFYWLSFSGGQVACAAVCLRYKLLLVPFVCFAVPYGHIAWIYAVLWRFPYRTARQGSPLKIACFRGEKLLTKSTKKNGQFSDRCGIL